MELGAPIFDINTLLKRERIGPLQLQQYIAEARRLKSLRAIPSTFKGPTFVSIDFTYRCNLRCVYCYNTSPFETEELTTAEWKEVIDDLVELGTFTICLTGGEPTLRADYLEIVEYAHGKGLAVNTASNGLLINEDLARKMKKSGIRTAQISLDGSTALINDRLRGSGSFDFAVRAVKALVGNGIPTAISCVVSKLNIYDFPNVVNLGERLGVVRVRSMYFLPIGRGRGLEPSNEDYEWISTWCAKQNLSGERKVFIEWGDPLEHIKILPYFPTFTFHITADGWVLLSPYLPYAYGNLRKKRLVELWRDGLNNAWSMPQLQQASESINSEEDFIKIERVYPGPYIDLSKA